MPEGVQTSGWCSLLIVLELFLQAGWVGSGCHCRVCASSLRDIGTSGLCHEPLVPQGLCRPRWVCRAEVCHSGGCYQSPSYEACTSSCASALGGSRPTRLPPHRVPKLFCFASLMLEW